MKGSVVRLLGVILVYGGFAAAFVAACVLGGNHANVVTTLATVAGLLFGVAIGVRLLNGPKGPSRVDLLKQVNTQRSIIRHLGRELMRENDCHQKGLALLDETFHRYKAAAHWIRDDRDAAEKEAEQLRVQLAGCSVAAFGGTNPEQVAKRGQYGWSPAYQDVIQLRRDHDIARSNNKRLREMLRDATDKLAARTTS
jgi:hypothetical protein